MDKVKVITITDNEDFLRQVSKPVIFPDKNLENDINILERYISQSDITLALAAVQLGIPKRLIYLKNTDLELINRKNNNQEIETDKFHNERRILINPVIISREGLTDYWEACASCLDNLGHVKRPYRIMVKYQDINGNFHNDVFEGFESTVLSHEIDHLDGVLHMDIADEVLSMTREERKEFRKTHGYNILSKNGNFQKLLEKYRFNSKEYTYNILDEVYYWMLSKQKNVEVRILKEKSNKIQVGDFITFNNQDYDGQFIKVKVIDKNIFDTVEELLTKYEVNNIMPNHTSNELRDLLNKIYGEELINKKIVAFKFEYVLSDKDGNNEKDD